MIWRRILIWLSVAAAVGYVSYLATVVPKASRANHSVPQGNQTGVVSGVEVGQAEIGLIEQRIELDPLPALPAKLIVQKSLPELVGAEAFFVIDGNLLRLPMRDDGSPSTLSAIFPTPKKDFFYRILFQFQDGSRAFSEYYRVQLDCFRKGVSEITGKALDAGDRKKYDNADELADELSYLSYAIAKLEQLTPGGVLQQKKGVAAQGGGVNR